MDAGRPMARLWLCLVAVGSAARGASIGAGEAKDNTLVRAGPAKDVDRTVAEVEALLVKNPALPRLTRGEIIALLENITRSDTSSDDAKRQRALVVQVMPFSASDASNGSAADLQELYTREPVTRIIGDDWTMHPSSTKKPPRRGNGTRRRKPPQQEQRPVYVHKLMTTTPTVPVSSTSNNWRPFTDYEATPGKPIIRPQAIDFDLPEEMRKTLGEFHFLDKAQTKKAIFVTVTTPAVPTSPRQEIQRVLASIGLMPDHTPTTLKPRVTTTSTTTTTTTAVPDMSAAAESLTPEMKDLLVSFGLMPDPNAPKKAVTQIPPKTTEPEPVFQFKSVNPTIDPSSYANFKRLPMSSANAERQENDLNGEMKDFLASFGLISDSTSKRRSQKSMSSDRSATVEPDVDDKTEGTTEEYDGTTEYATEYATEDATEDVTKGATETTTEIVDTTTTQDSLKSMPDINMDLLTDDMKKTLESLGLMEPGSRVAKKLNHVFNPASHTALLEQSDEVVRINRLLDRIKELSSDNKTQSLSQEQIKAILDEDIHNVGSEDSEPSEVVENLESEEGISEESVTTAEGVTEESIKTEESSQEENLFDGSNSIDADQSVPAKGLQQIADPPDPLSLEELRQMLAADKNEFKRQKPPELESDAMNTTDVPTTELPTTESSTPSTTSTSPSDSSASGSGADNKPSEADLEASFPGVPSSTPRSRRPNGLYFLVDWNSFLRVGDGSNGRMVDLTFNPRVGDPRNFVPDTGPIV